MAEQDESRTATPALHEMDYCAGIAYDASSSSCANCGAGEPRRRSDRVSVEDDGMGTDLELCLCLGATKASDRCLGAARRESCKILTARDFPSVVASRGSPMSSASSSASSPPMAGAGEGAGEGNGGIAGCKRAADHVSFPDMRYRSPSQVVGWPPIRAYRINSLMNHNKDVLSENKSRHWSHEKVIAKSAKMQNDGVKEDAAGKDEEKICVSERSRFVKVNMDGMPIGRKVDISAHQTYESLALALEDMFQKPRSISSPRST